MMTREEWETLSDEKKLDYLFEHSVATERAVGRIGSTLQLLHERLLKVEAAVAETAA